MDNKINKKQSDFPKITIVTVVINLIKNNRIKLFERCVKSIQTQTYPNIEHIVIDGASTDGTIELLEEMNLNYISEKDTGIYDAMNKGVKRASGKYIAFMNSDDYYASPNAIQEAINKLIETNADAVYGDVYFIENNQEPEKAVRFHIGSGLYHVSVSHQGFFCTVDSLKEIGLFDTTYKIAADFDSFYKMILTGKLILPVDSIIAYFSIGGLSSTQIELSKEEAIRVIYENISRVHPSFTYKKAVSIYKKKLMPLFLYLKLRKHINPQMVRQFNHYFIKYTKRFMMRWLFTFRLNKKPKCVRICGLTLFGKPYN